MPAAPVRAPGVVDRHVHLGLVDRTVLAGGPVVEVHDLGWIPDDARRWRDDPPPGVVVRVAGPFLAPVGGYPRGRSWAPDASVREVPDAAAGRAAIAAAVGEGFDLVKVTLHTGFPPFAPGALDALVGSAHDAGLPVVAHVEGRGATAVALQAGVDALAHVPWSERLDERTVALMAERTEWISTLALHRGWARRTALHNARRFVAAGGRLRYGTDTGNGPEPAGLRVREVLALGAAGLSGAGLVEALSGAPGGLPGERAVVVGAGPVPERAADVAAWYRAARPESLEGAA